MYHAKVLELREVIEDWLAYIPNTFPHYTRHTVRHSDEIVRQLSKLLFQDEDANQPVLPLTAVEAYLVIAAAYLHDAGMVVSDREKLELLQTDEWKSWISGSNAGAKRWNEIQTLRNGNEPADPIVRDFLADLETRFLVAEFVRRTHHLRARTVIEQHQAMLGRFAFDDLVLQRSIGDLCVSHGLRTHELEDHERFPDRRDIRGEAVNMRLMAILLRLGDLLDMSADRACPLLLNAACPLPADSLAHWTQYQRITHRLTAPDRIEITAECQYQTEHRVLQDWCQWIVDEVRAARTLLSRARRHHNYELPVAEIDGNDKTIIIRRSSTATYFPSSWTFQLDQEAVLQRLIYDAYKGSEVFIRELIQNALDANRCQMYADLISESKTPPQYPTQVPEEIRSRYPVSISLKWIEMQNPLSEENERRQVLTISDRGIGMDKDIIQRYFLQVGRSFYTTDEFRRHFRFVPTSRFGIGFLSTFAVSDLINVETFKPSSAANDGPLRLTLTGPRNYLLTEEGRRRANGTDIEVLLREPLEDGDLTALVERWCRRVEFPILVDDLGKSRTILAETPDQFIYDVPDVTEDQARLIVRSFPIDRPGIEGELYVFARVTSAGEAWDRYGWAKYEYPQLHPGAARPAFPHELECLHGIAIQEEYAYVGDEGYSSRLDYRGEGPSITLSRDINRTAFAPLINSRWEEILRAHLSTSPLSISEDGWKYRQRLVEIFSFYPFWRSYEGMIPLQINGMESLVSLDFTQRLPVITTVTDLSDTFAETDNAKRPTKKYEIPSPVLIQMNHLSGQHTSQIFVDRGPIRLYWLDRQHIAIDWSSAEDAPRSFAKTNFAQWFFSDLPATTIGFGIAWRRSRVLILLNIKHHLVKWLMRVQAACMNNDYSFTPTQWNVLTDLLEPLLRHGDIGSSEALSNYLNAWSHLPNLPVELRPPKIHWTARMFERPKWQDAPKKRNEYRIVRNDDA